MRDERSIYLSIITTPLNGTLFFFVYNKGENEILGIEFFSSSSSPIKNGGNSWKRFDGAVHFWRLQAVG